MQNLIEYSSSFLGALYEYLFKLCSLDQSQNLNSKCAKLNYFSFPQYFHFLLT